MSGPLTWLDEGITAVGGLSVGHATHPNGRTGVTVTLFEHPVPGAAHLMGGGTSTRQFGSLDPHHVSGRLHALCFAGGSAFGLDAGTGVARWLEARGRGLPVMPGLVVPVVPTAILFDLPHGDARPDAALAEAACDAAVTEGLTEGSVGAGAGATVGKCEGLDRCMKGGVGHAAARLPDGTRVGALVAVNAFGDIRDPETGAPVAGLRATAEGLALASSRTALIERGGLRRYRAEDWQDDSATTLALVAVDRSLARVELAEVARLAGHGLVKAVDPVATPVDGDLVVAVSTTGDERAPGTGTPDATVVGLAAADVVARAIVRAVQHAVGWPGVPGLADPT